VHGAAQTTGKAVVFCEQFTGQTVNEEIFGDISILTRENAPEDEFAFVTPVAKEGELVEKLGKLEDIEILGKIRVENY
jgi:hypothetical protein